MSDFGYVYCMTNNCMPDMCKIGCIYKKIKHPKIEQRNYI